MAKDPAMLLYTADFLVGTMMFTDEQVGQYIRLLCLQHQNGGLICEEDMINICKSPTSPVIKKFKQDRNGNYYNERAKAEADRRAKYSNSRRINRLGKKDMNNISKTYVQHMETETITETKTEAKNKKKASVKKIEIVMPFDSPRFAQSWAAWMKYRKEIGKPYKSDLSQQAALKNLSKHPEQTAIAMIEQSIANSWQGIFEIKKTYGSKSEQVTQHNAEQFARLMGKD